jgi:DNA-binding beta-propeller fold protein YncE
MAELLKKLEDELTCLICLHIYTDPKLLQCVHVYCQQCLVPLVAQNQQEQFGITCPSCRQVTPVPDGGTVGLKSAYHTNNLLEILASSRNNENLAAALERAASPESDENPVRTASHCLDHKDMDLVLYCETCGELICCICALKGGKHQNHDYSQLHQAFEKYKTEITSLLEPMEKKETTAKEALAQLNARHGEISDQRAAMADKIRDTFRQLQVLDVKEAELIGQLDKITKGKLKRLATQIYQIETTLVQLNHCIPYMRDILGKVDKEDVLRKKSITVHRVKELTTPFQSDILKPNTEANIELSVTESMIESCHVEILSSGPLDASKCDITGKGAQVAAVGETSTAILKACNFEGMPCKGPIEALKCEVVSERTGTRASCSVERRGQSQYEISYQPIIKGRHLLHVKAEGQHVRGSPFPIAVVKSSFEKPGTPVLTIGEVRGPWGIAINQRGEVVVAECDGHHISVFSPSGEKILSFGTCGSGLGKIFNPREIALDGEGNILVVEYKNHRIQKFAREGKLLAFKGTEGSGEQQFDRPTGITFNPSNGKWYVTDTFNSCVKVLNSDLSFSSTFGSKGDGEGQFHCPTSIACDSTGKVYVADSKNNRIQVFTEEGNFKMKINSRGQEGGELDNPVGIAIDTSDMVYICEDFKCRVSVFTSKGQFVTSFGEPGKEPGKFENPRGLAVDNSGVVYVCDRGNNRVQIF